ncbi:nuclear transport factor 2 family protein [Chitinophaga sp. OAE865]|uniref:nuclear transport factor 2 family protein n=1 Tax=Chitinophaga sp. OAE865 TaxID=2817898 RepID=UPI001AE44306
MSSYNKAIVLAALKHLIGERNTSVIDTYVHDSYIQHSPMVKDGKAGLLEAVEQLKQYPAPASARSPVVRTIADGNYVMLHMDVAFMGKNVAVVDLYRLENGKLAEHWDATQENAVTEGAAEIRDLHLTASNKAIIAQYFRQPDKALLQPGYQSHSPLPSQDVEVHRVIGEGNFVMVQSSTAAAVYYDIFRLENSLLAEHWQVRQAIPATIPHNNGMI